MEPSFSLQALESSPNKHFDVMQCFAWYISKRIHLTVESERIIVVGSFFVREFAGRTVLS